MFEETSQHTDRHDDASERFVEQLRLQAFRIYEHVRAQRARDPGRGDRLRELARASELAADLARQMQSTVQRDSTRPGRPISMYRRARFSRAAQR